MRRHWCHWAIVSFLAASLSLVVGYGLFFRPITIRGNQSLIIRVEKNSSAVTFARELSARHWILSSRLFSLWIRWKGWSSQLKAGVYVLKPGETARQLLERVIAGDVLVLPFRISEGSTQATLSKQLEQLPYINYQASDWATISQPYDNAEGLLLADTYHYEAGSSSAVLLARAHHDLMQCLNENWDHRSPSLPYTSPYQLLIAASIIEKEAAKPDERRIIAGVIVNRLQKRMPLQMDPTVIYALGATLQGKLTHDALSIESPYNTYKHYGLPPTPIAMVGKEAIAAAANPTVTNYLYFVARGDGSHQFSATYAQQKRAINQYKQKQDLGRRTESE